MKKLSKVVMLPTEKVASLVIRHDKPCVVMLSTDSPFAKKETHTYQHLYSLSDEEIKEGDWMLDEGVNKIHQCNQSGFARDGFRKIIASTDESLGLPRPSNEFINKYCEVGGIDEVLVEYKCEYEDCNMFGCHKYEGCSKMQLLKVAPDNTITIYPIK